MSRSQPLRCFESVYIVLAAAYGLVVADVFIVIAPGLFCTGGTREAGAASWNTFMPLEDGTFCAVRGLLEF